MTISLDQAGNETTYEYDLNDFLVRVQHPGTGTSDRTFTRNSLGWVLNDTQPESGTTRHEYNEFGELAKQEDALGRIMNITYDPRGRVTATTHDYLGNTKATNYYYDGDQVPGHTATYVNPEGNRTGMVDASGTTLWPEHDHMNQAIKQEFISAGHSFVQSRTHDSRGNVDSLTYPELVGAPTPRNVISIAYNESNKASSVVSNSSDTLVSAVVYGSNLLFSQITLGNGVAISRPMLTTLRNRPQRIETIGAKHSDGTPNELVLDYGWDVLGRVETVTTNGRIDTFTYDPRGQIASATYGAEGTITYTYDVHGNVTDRSSVAFSSFDFSRAYSDNRVNWV